MTSVREMIYTIIHCNKTRKKRDKMTDRRSFVTGAVAAAGILGCTGPAFGRKVGVSGGTRGRILFGACRSKVEDVKIMRDLGYDFWEWSAGAAFDPAKDDAWWQRQKEEIAKRPLPLRSCNQFIPGKFRLTGPKADHAPALDYAEKILRRADEIGVKTVVFGSGGARNVPKDLAKADPSSIERGMAQYADFCAALAKRVADLRTVQVVVEPLRPKESNIVNFVWQGQKIVEQIDSPRIRLLADIFHMMMGEEKPDSIVKAGPLLKHVHIADYDTRQFPGSNPGQTQMLKPYFDALKAIGYDGGVSCECRFGNASDFAKNAKTAIETMKGLI